MRRIVLTLTALLCLLGVGIQPAQAYWDDVHYYLTYYVARTVGYTPEQACRAAAADLSVDYSEATEPTQMSVTDYVAGAREDTPEKQRPRWMFHAFRDETRFPGAVGNDPKAAEADKAISEQLDALWRAAQGANSVNPGVYLHFVQDLGPHFGFGSAFGHYFNPADPKGSTLKAVQAGLQLGGTVDWLGSRTPAPYKSVQLMTATSLAEFLRLMSPRQQGREWGAAKVDELVERLTTVNDYPSPLGPSELPAYIAYVKARKGFGTMPALTAQQQIRFAKHLDGPDLNAAAAEVASAMKAARMMEETVPSHLQARKQFTFDANGNVVPGQLDGYVLTGSLRVTVPATGARAEPYVMLAIKAPPTYWNDKEYDLVPAGGNRQLPFAVTYEQIPVGEVTVEVQSPVGDVLASQVVKIGKRQNETTLRVPPGKQVAPSGEKQPVWVLKPGSPEVKRKEASANEYSREDYSLSEKLASTHTRSVPGNPNNDEFDQLYQWTITGAPPKLLRPGDKFTLAVAGNRAGRKSARIAMGEGLSLRTEGLVNRLTGEPFDTFGSGTALKIAEAPNPPGCSAVYDFAVPSKLPGNAVLEWSPGAGSVRYEWEYRLVTPQEAQQLASGAGLPAPVAPGAQPATPGGKPQPPTPAGSGAGPTRTPSPGGTASPAQPPSVSQGLGMTVEGRKGPDGKPIVVVTKMDEDSPFTFALAPGDVILAVDGVRIGTPGELGTALAKKKAGDTVAVLVRRGEFEIELTATIGGP